MESKSIVLDFSDAVDAAILGNSANDARGRLCFIAGWLDARKDVDGRAMATAIQRLIDASPL